VKQNVITRPEFLDINRNLRQLWPDVLGVKEFLVGLR
jgi:hypothetical protein